MAAGVAVSAPGQTCGTCGVASADGGALEAVHLVQGAVVLQRGMPEEGHPKTPPRGPLRQRRAPSAAPKAAAEEAEAKTPEATGPACLRCRRPSGACESDRHEAVIVQRSIFAPACDHRPYCRRCADRMRTQTLPFCHGCSALVARIEACVPAAPTPPPPPPPPAEEAEPQAVGALSNLD
eukprot:CAMPEP_0176082996 /NCGR_PEP_ID=MMETSP0120_2-20121206/41519_1 /TAXON_ID=160619 /ORGANISM="Kryptoperidinium foliaceum, Strain CCMP 1326" /LENGTH=179 /DNA_ID=CAMNT_0017416771 /DNA_START=19 /DNA_END=557 /DNA_ORIENTATION=+